MTRPSLARYLDPEVLQQVAARPLEPKELVLGHLAGLHRSPLAGFAVEFAGHREYVPGDDVRHLDWKVYYKRFRYFIKQYEMETNYICHLFIDVSGSMHYGDGSQQKLCYAASLAMCLAYCVVRQHDQVSLGLFDQRLRSWVPPGGSLVQLIKFADQLDQLTPSAGTALTSCLLELLGRTGRRELVIILSDFLTDLTALEDVLQRMRYAHHDVAILQVLHRDEATFPFHGTLRCRGLESEPLLDVSADDIRQEYLELVHRHQQQLQILCERHGIDFLSTLTDHPPAKVLWQHLDQREQRQRTI
ncbi:MAG: hypothetical protein KatS3mg113_0264 [Planctomycetaceae bacterium]|nr:MAG: hypothetical protein KatS3mg113_0264 [Planctomycetaceae bacterium]